MAEEEAEAALDAMQCFAEYLDDSDEIGGAGEELSWPVPVHVATTVVAAARAAETDNHSHSVKVSPSPSGSGTTVRWAAGSVGFGTGDWTG
eukprot:COSAG01_NODE_7378_length_3230_cov_3.997126_3_plen_90_part_01